MQQSERSCHWRDGAWVREAEIDDIGNEGFSALLVIYRFFENPNVGQWLESIPEIKAFLHGSLLLRPAAAFPNKHSARGLRY